MVNYSTINFNTTNKHLSSQIFEHKRNKKHSIMGVRNLGLLQANKSGRVKLINEIATLFVV